MKRITLFFTVLLLSLTITHGQNTYKNSAIEQDSLALVALYNATDGDNWNNKTNWLTGNLDTWHGITLDENSRVIKIRLVINKLNGSLPTEIENLTQLTSLDLSANQLTGNIPNEFENLINLTNINLSDNKLTGNIPPEIGSLKNLTRLMLEKNQLTGSIPPETGNLTKLTNLFLYSNQLTGDIPSEIGNLSNLIYLALSNNQLTGNIPSEVGQLTKLRDISLSSNKLTGDIQTELNKINNLTDLKDLDLSDNQLTGNFPSDFGNLNNLTEFGLHSNQITGSIPVEIKNLPNIRVLNAHSNQLTGSLPEEFKNLVKMECLHLYNNQLDGLVDLTSFTKFTFVTLENNAFDFGDLKTANISASFSYTYSPQAKTPVTRTEANNQITFTCNVEGSNNQYKWYKNETEISGETTNILTVSNTEFATYQCKITDVNFPKLTLETVEEIVKDENSAIKQDSLALVAFYNATNGENWGNWLKGNLDTWYGVTLNENGRVVKIEINNQYSLKGNIPPEIGNLTKLKILDLDQNKLTGNIPPEIGNLSNLEKLDLHYNELTGSIPPEIGNLNNLKVLTLNNNELTGSIPSEIGNLTKLEEIYLTYTKITGSIPAEIGNLTKLRRVFLQRNQLTGSIPPEIGNLINSTELYLSQNQLTGSIPPEIGNLSSIQSIGLSSNQLTGNIPPEIGNLTNVKTITISYNQLTGSIPSEIGNLTNLEIIYIEDNQLTGNIPTEIGNLTKLKNIFLDDNQLSGNFPIEIGKLTNLKRIRLDKNQLTGSIPNEIGELSEIIEINLNNNKLTGSIPIELFKLTNLEELYLGNNQFTGKISTEIKKLTKLKKLDLSYINFTELPDISPLKNLTKLNIEVNNLDFKDLEDSKIKELNYFVYGDYFTYSPQAKIPVTRTETSNQITLSCNVEGSNNQYQWYRNKTEISGKTTNTLTVTDIEVGTYQCKITDVNYPKLTLETIEEDVVNNPFSIKQDSLALVAFYNTTDGESLGYWLKWLKGNLDTWKGITLNENGRVERIEIGARHLKGTIPPEMGNLTKLKVMNLGGNDLTGTIPAEIGNLTNLQLLYLNDNKLTGEIPSEIGNLSNLDILKLDQNELTESIPSEIGNLNNLKNLILNNNELTGSLPPEMGNLAKLERIDLTNNQITGNIPAEIGNLTKLKTIYLQKNQLTGNIPPEIGNLPNLTELHLSQNQLSGNIPSEIGNLTKLKAIGLNSNQLTGNIPPEIGNLINLKTISITNNQLSGSIPIEIGNLANLEIIYLFKNQLTGSIPAEIGNSTKLKNIFFYENQLSGNIPTQFGKLVNLKQLYLNDNKLTGSIPVEIGDLPDVVKINLNNNQLTGNIPNEICKLTNLTEICLGKNLFVGNIPVEIKKLTNLNKLDLSYCNFTELPDFTSIVYLKHLKIEANNFDFKDLEDSKIKNIHFYDLTYSPQEKITISKTKNNNQITLTCNTDNAEGNVYQWYKDENLITNKTNKAIICNISGNYKCKITNSNFSDLTLETVEEIVDFETIAIKQDSLALVALYNATNNQYWRNKENWLTGNLDTWYGITLDETGRVKEVNLSKNNLTGNIPDEIWNLTNLENLDLGSNSIKGNISPKIEEFTKLKKINFAHTQLNSTIPPEIGNLNKLQILHLNFSSLKENIPPEIGNLTNLEELLLTGNKLTGTIPSEIGNLTNLQHISLSQNELTGNIPSEIGNLTKLKKLYFTNNELTGNIPSEIGNLTNIEKLYFSHNQLTGSIPTEIGKLANLKYLSLEHNQLSGSIPSEIGNLINSEYFRLGKNKLTGSIPSEMGNLSNLIELRLDNNELTGNIPSEFDKLISLNVLILDDNKLTGNIPSEINKLPNLLSITLQNNQLTELTDISLFPKLRILRVASNNLDFKDLEDAKVKTSMSFTYSPQGKITINKTQKNNQITLTCNTDDAADNVYQWYRDENLITDETNKVISCNISGNYKCKITNSNFSDLILETEELTLETVEVIATANPTEGGTITGNQNYEIGATAELVATANENYDFVNWTEAGTEVSTDVNYSFEVTQARTLVANFVKKTVEITATANPTEGGTITGNKTYEIGANASLKATANENYDFVNWKEGENIVSTETTYSFTVSVARTLIANFTKKKVEITATANPTEGGTITGNQTYEIGANASLKATANENYNFVNWKEGENIVSTETTYSFTVSEARTLVANFTKKTVEITATANPTEGGTITGNKTYEIGANAELIATANENYNFVNWTENGTEVSTEATYSFTVSEARTLVANFEKKTVEITATANPTEGGTITGNKTYEIGANASLKATANENYNFVNWTENGTEVSTETTYSFTVSEARTLVANFEKKTVEITATANPTEGGTITGNQTYEIGANASLKATANENYNFVNWTEAGTEVSTDATYSFTVSVARTLVANFKLDDAAISDENTKSEIKLYPNPAKDIVTIQANNLKDVKLSLFDFSGKKQNIKILNKNSNQIQIDISDKKAGVYFLQILIDNKIIKTNKFVIIR